MTLLELLGDKFKEGMTADEITAALSEYQPPDIAQLTAEITKLKETNDKLASENADKKRKIKEYEVGENKNTELTARIGELERSLKINETKANLITAGMQAENAAVVAAAIADGDTEAVTKIFAEHSAYVAKSTREAIMLDTPKPPPGSPGGKDGLGFNIPKTPEEFKKLSYDQMLKLKSTHPDVAKKFIGG